jgi:hypothetical protein
MCVLTTIFTNSSAVSNTAASFLTNARLSLF